MRSLIKILFLFLSMSVWIGSAHGQTKPESPNEEKSNGFPDVEVLSDTNGIDVTPYVKEVAKKVRTEWLPLVPENARAPMLKQGKVTIGFAILAKGKVTGMHLVQSSGDTSMDRAAWGGIYQAQPFPELPKGIEHGYLQCRFHFYYNLKKPSSDTATTQNERGATSAPPKTDDR